MVIAERPSGYVKEQRAQSRDARAYAEALIALATSLPFEKIGAGRLARVPNAHYQLPIVN